MIDDKQRTIVALYRVIEPGCILCTAPLRRRTQRRTRPDHTSVSRVPLGPQNARRRTLVAPPSARTFRCIIIDITRPACFRSSCHPTICDVCPKSTAVASKTVLDVSCTLHDRLPAKVPERCLRFTQRGKILTTLRIRSSRPIGVRPPTLFNLAFRQDRSCLRKFRTRDAVETFMGSVYVIRRLDTITASKVH